MKRGNSYGLILNINDLQSLNLGFKQSIFLMIVSHKIGCICNSNVFYCKINASSVFVLFALIIITLYFSSY